MLRKMRYYGSALSLSDVNPRNSYGWGLSLKKGSVASELIGIFGVPHLGARIRHRMLTKIIKKGNGRKKIFDVGCGFGLESLYLYQKGYKVLGLDKSPAKTSIAKEIARNLGVKNVRFETGDIFKKNSKESFDYIVLFEVLEHVKNPKRMLRKIAGFVKNGGSLVVSFPSTHYINRISKEQLGHEYIGYKPGEVNDMVKKNNLKIKKICTFGNTMLAKGVIYVDYMLLKHLPYLSAFFFFISYPIAVLDVEYFSSKDPMGYVLVLRKDK